MLKDRRGRAGYSPPTLPSPARGEGISAPWAAHGFARLAAVLFLAVECAALGAGCGAVTAADGRAVCRPTGWVDRVEGKVVVLVPDEGEEEEYYPIGCFAHPPAEGHRIVRGRFDRKQTEATRKAIDAILARIMGDPPRATPTAPAP